MRPKKAGGPALPRETRPQRPARKQPNQSTVVRTVLAKPHFGNISSAVVPHSGRISAAGLFSFLAPWIACFCGFFGILVIGSRLVTGLVSLALCALLLCLPRGGGHG